MGEWGWPHRPGEGAVSAQGLGRSAGVLQGQGRANVAAGHDGGCRGRLSHRPHAHMHLFINSPFTQPGQVPGSKYLHTHTHRPCPTPQHTRALEGLAHLKHNPGFLEQVLGGYGTRDHAPVWGSMLSSSPGSQ